MLLIRSKSDSTVCLQPLFLSITVWFSFPSPFTRNILFHFPFSFHIFLLLHSSVGLLQILKQPSNVPCSLEFSVTPLYRGMFSPHCVPISFNYICYLNLYSLHSELFQLGLAVILAVFHSLPITVYSISLSLSFPHFLFLLFFPSKKSIYRETTMCLFCSGTHGLLNGQEEI